MTDLDHDLEVKYVMVRTHYNNRLILNEKYKKILDRIITYYNEDIKEEDDGREIFKLLYVHHNGYTWFDTEQENPKYKFGSEEEIDEWLSLGMEDKGCFVFKFDLEEGKTISFFNLLFDFIDPMTNIKFCGHFNMRNLYETKYYEDKKVILFDFDTESG